MIILHCLLFQTCGKSFVVKHYYLMHLNTHAPALINVAGTQDPLPYKCDVCDKAFSVKQYLATHKLRHRSKSNTAAAAAQQSIINEQQQQTTTGSSNSVNNASLSNEMAHTSDAIGTVAIQSVIERNEQNSTFVNNQYHGNVEEFQ